MDYTDAQLEYNSAVLEDSSSKADYKRRKFLKDNPLEVKTKADKTLVAKEVTHYYDLWQTIKQRRKDAKKEMDEAKKALDSHKEEEAKGFVRTNDIVKVGSQYKAHWTHLPA